MSETYVTYRVWDGCKAPINLEYSGRLIGEIARELTVDRDALLALAGTLESEAEECGRLYVDTGEQEMAGEYTAYRDCARRIRKACGTRLGDRYES